MTSAGDIVLLNQRGRVFHARVTSAPLLGRFSIAPIERDVHARSAHTREILRTYKEQPQAPDPRAAGQLQLVDEATV